MTTSFLNIKNETKGRPPRLPFVSIKNKILGKNYDLSLSFISSQKQRSINSKYRGLNKSTNILSFSLSSNSGEILIDLSKAKREAPIFNMSYSQFIKYLVIHGMLHLKGFEHSSTMERQEEKYLKIFS
ncbi:MAG TPA: rRNA maturation RNase YbeY [Candidatus Paceibacterota bacterium]|nr:rRNA maturation RNase YbeY [Candidatus Paceibacterota bacterium]